MLAKYILGVLAVAFLAAALERMSRGGGITHPQTKHGRSSAPSSRR